MTTSLGNGMIELSIAINNMTAVPPHEARISLYQCSNGSRIWTWMKCMSGRVYSRKPDAGKGKFPLFWTRLLFFPGAKVVDRGRLWPDPVPSPNHVETSGGTLRGGRGVAAIVHAILPDGVE